MNGKHNDLIRRFALSAILEGKLPCGLHGTVTQIEAFSAALYATRTFDALLKRDVTLNEATDALKVKRAAAARFKRVFGVAWPA